MASEIEIVNKGCIIISLQNGFELTRKPEKILADVANFGHFFGNLNFMTWKRKTFELEKLAYSFIWHY